MHKEIEDRRRVILALDSWCTKWRGRRWEDFLYNTNTISKVRLLWLEYQAFFYIMYHRFHPLGYWTTGCKTQWSSIVERHYNKSGDTRHIQRWVCGSPLHDHTLYGSSQTHNTSSGNEFEGKRWMLLESCVTVHRGSKIPLTFSQPGKRFPFYYFKVPYGYRTLNRTTSQKLLCIEHDFCCISVGLP